MTLMFELIRKLDVESRKQNDQIFILNPSPAGTGVGLPLPPVYSQVCLLTCEILLSFIPFVAQLFVF
jgi:hypothetical protein